MTIDLPHPPMTVAGPETAIKAGERTVVTLKDGKKLIGALREFSAGQACIVLEMEGRPQRVALGDTKIVAFPTPRPWKRRPTAIEQQGKGVVMPGEAHEFEVQYHDGSTVSGKTLGFRTDRNGLHLFPTVGADQYIHTFTPSDAIKNQRLGEQLGTVLVNEHLAPKEAVESALAAQAESRNRPLGEYLKTKSVVTTEELERALARQQTMPNLKLGEILLSENVITQAKLDEALKEQSKDRSRPLGEILIKMGAVTLEQVQLGLAKKLGIPFVDLREFQIIPDVLRLVPKELASKHRVMPIAIHDGKLVVATENPMEFQALDALRFHTKMYSEPVLALQADIDWAIRFYYPTHLIQEATIEELAALEEGGDETDHGAEDDAITDNVVVKLINKIILDAHDQHASDIHIEPYGGKNRTVIRFRKDGTLINYHELPPQYRNGLISRIKIMAHLDISERRKPQDGKIDFKKFGPANIELRVATIPTAGGLEDVVLRILASGEPIPLEKLGLGAGNSKMLQRIVAKPYGLFLVCGPTGSGKTTSLHSILGYINTPDRKIWTAEDPVEITQKGLRQVQVNPRIGLDFASALRAFLRADPDVIMVGEMRDKETVTMGIEASLTGHLVFSTLHTNSAPESIVRLLDLGMDPFNFTDALLGILAQRLAKRLCLACKQAYTATTAEVDALLDEYCHELSGAADPQAVRNQILAEWRQQYADSKTGGFTLYRATGCRECDKTGYRGRVGLYELLEAGDRVKKAILDRLPVTEMTRIAIAEGMRTLKQDGITKVLQGLTDMSRVRAVCIK